MPSKTADRERREHVGIDDMPTEVGHEADGGGGGPVEPAELFQTILVLAERRPTIEVRDRRDANDSLGQLAILGRILEIVGRTNHARVQVDQLVALPPLETRPIVIKHDRPIMAQVAGLDIQYRHRFDERHLARSSRLDDRLVVAQPQRFHGAGRGQNIAGHQFGAVVQHDADGAAIFHANPADAAPQTQLAAQFAEAADQVLEDQPHAFERPGHPFQENAAEHDAELAPVHILLAGVAVPHQRAQQHFNQQRLVEQFPQSRSTRHSEMLVVQIVVIDDGGEQSLEVVGLAGKEAADFRFQPPDLVVEIEMDAGKGDPRADLGRERQVFPFEPQLPQQPGQRSLLRALRGEVRDRMQADIEIAAAEAIKRIQSADRGVAFEHAHLLLVVGQPNAGGEARHSRADDQRVVHRGLLANTSDHFRREVGHGAVHAGQLAIILFGNLNAVPLPQFHDNVEEVHAVERQLLAERLAVVQGAEIIIGSDVGQDIDDFFADLCGTHCGRRPQTENFLMMATELMPNIPKELLRMYWGRPISRG